MAGNIQLKARIKSATSISKITRAMEAVSASKMMKSQKSATQGVAYTQSLGQIVRKIKSQGGDFSHPFLAEADTAKPVLTIIISSDRGLCGSFNTSLFRTLERQFEPRAKVITMGRKSYSYAKKTDWQVLASIEKLGDFPATNEVFAVGLVAIEAFKAGSVGKVQIAYQQFVNTLTQRVVIEQLLPIPSDPEDDLNGGGSAKYIFEPGPTELLPQLLDYSIRAKLYQAVLSSKAAEQSARMVAMKNASKSAKEVREGLQAVYNKDYQKAITAEILDVVTASMALNKR